MRRVVAVTVFTAALVGAAGCLAPGTAPDELHARPFLVCTRAHESDVSDVNHNGLHDGGYRAYNPAGYKGAYQFAQSTWDRTAVYAGYDWLVGRDPRDVSDYEQDVMAWELYLWQGNRPWGGRC